MLNRLSRISKIFGRVKGAPRLHPAPAQTIDADVLVPSNSDVDVDVDGQGSLLERIVGGKCWWFERTITTTGSGWNWSDPVLRDDARMARMRSMRDYYRSLCAPTTATSAQRPPAAATIGSGHPQMPPSLDSRNERGGNEERRILQTPDLTIPTVGGRLHLDQ